MAIVGVLGRGWPASIPIRREFGTDRRGWVLARRSISDPTEIAYYVCYGHAAPGYANWSASPAPAGRSRNRSRPPRTRSAWTTTRSAATTPGTPTSPSPWPPPRSSPPPAPAKPKRGQRSRGRHAHPTQQQRDPTPLGKLVLIGHTSSSRAVLVDLATTPPSPSQSLPLPQTSYSARFVTILGSRLARDNAWLHDVSGQFGFDLPRWRCNSRTRPTYSLDGRRRESPTADR